MKSVFQLISDIHIEREYPSFPDWKHFIYKRCENIILAGDIGHLELFDQYSYFIKSVCESFEKVYLVPGNHEFYSKKYNITYLMSQLEKLKIENHNLIILNNNYVDLPGDIRLYGSTLWCHIPEECRTRTLDIISEDNSPVDATWLNREHYKSLYNLEKNIINARNDAKRLVVVTHYAPSMLCVQPRHLLDNTKFYYANNLDRLLTKENIYSYLFGHTHHNVDYINHENTRLVTNQFRAPNYNRKKMISIKHYAY